MLTLWTLIVETLGPHCPSVSLVPETRLDSLPCDSLDSVETLLELEEALGLSLGAINEDCLPETLGEMEAHLEALLPTPVQVM